MLLSLLWVVIFMILNIYDINIDILILIKVVILILSIIISGNVYWY